jgi:hypothetical protein
MPSTDMKNEAGEVYTGSRSAWMRVDPDAIRASKGTEQDVRHEIPTPG